ncbi:MAG: BTAD domain-containing putative transcriptional regulator [Chloroflexota bacterium]
MTNETLKAMAEGKKRKIMLSIHLLNQIKFEQDGKLLESLMVPKLQLLLGYLIINRNRAVSRDHLAQIMWPDRTESTGRNNLRRLLHRVRQQLPNADQHIQATSHSLSWLTSGGSTIDLIDYESALTDYENPAAIQQIVQDAPPQFMPGMTEDWVIEAENKLKQLWRQGLEMTADLCVVKHQIGGAVDAVSRLLDESPLNENIYRRLMQLHMQHDNRPAAVMVYYRCVQTLRDTLGIPPSAPTRDLHQKLLMSDAMVEVELEPEEVRMMTPMPKFVSTDSGMHLIPAV